MTPAGHPNLRDGHPADSPWPHAILHLDGDSFFVGVEQAISPTLQGLPVVSGEERGIVTAASYEAKAYGITRGMRMFEVRQLCPQCVIVSSDYDAYRIFSERMFDIVRRFAPRVEEYSIDEGFADLSGLPCHGNASYSEVAYLVQRTISKELKLRVSVGVGPNKVLAKVASKYAKPFGITVMAPDEVAGYLERLPVGKLWGIGPNTTRKLESLGCKTALQFARLEEAYLRARFTKPIMEVWSELNGHFIYPVDSAPKTEYQSISKVKTFKPPSEEPQFLLSQLSKNLENACRKARRYGLAATVVAAYLKTQTFIGSAQEMKLPRPNAHPVEIMPLVERAFARIYAPNTPYRTTGITLCGLMPQEQVQCELFFDSQRLMKMRQLYNALDDLTSRFGRHTIQLGSSLSRAAHTEHHEDRDDMIKHGRENRDEDDYSYHPGIVRIELEV